MNKIWKIVIAILVSLFLVSIVLLISNRYVSGTNTNGNKIPVDVIQSETRIVSDP